MKNREAIDRRGLATYYEVIDPSLIRTIHPKTGIPIRRKATSQT
jgi:hypothetical protein